MALKPVFVDTWFIIALINPNDQANGEARRLFPILRTATGGVVLTDAVLIEAGNALAAGRREQVADYIGRVLNLADPRMRMVEINGARLAKALDLYRQRRDKEWGLTDCASIVVMEEEGIQEVATGDGHFREAGFTLLMRERGLGGIPRAKKRWF